MKYDSLKKKLSYWMFQQIPDNLVDWQLDWLDQAYKDVDNLIALMGAEEILRGDAAVACESHKENLCFAMETSQMNRMNSEETKRCIKK